MDNIKVSIIMPSLNVAKYIRESIESAINQTLKEKEIICVDAGSTDGTPEIIKEFVGKDSRVRLVNSPVKSYGYQMNLGISEAHGEYIGILETDDYVKPEMYEELYDIAEKQQVDLVRADYYNFVTEDGIAQLKYNRTGKSMFYGRVINPAEEPKVIMTKVNTWTGIYKRSFLEANNIKHNESAGAAYQDNGFFFETLSCAERVYFVKKAYYFCRRDNPNSSVYNPKWFPRMLAEYEFIYNRLKERALLETFKGPFARKKYSFLKSGFDSAPQEEKQKYCDIFFREMARHIKTGEYDRRFFNNSDWKWLQMLMNDPEGFCIKRARYKGKKFSAQIDDVKNFFRNIFR